MDQIERLLLILEKLVAAYADSVELEKSKHRSKQYESLYPTPRPECQQSKSRS